MNVFHDFMPAALRQSGLFCCWRYEERNGKQTKVPYNPVTGGGAQSTNPNTFAPFAVALDAMRRCGYDGIGVGIFGNLGAIDIDHCISDAGELSPMAAWIIDVMDTYTELSPSRHGIRILFTVPEGFQYDKARYYINNQNAGLEIYIAGATSKYVTVTGDVRVEKGLEMRGDALLKVLESYMKRPVKVPVQEIPAQSTNVPAADTALDDAALIHRIRQSKNGEKFSKLWSGDTSGYKSQSEADIALCDTLAWWTNGDAAQVDRLFRQSGLMRPKWDERRGGGFYGANTIQNAVATLQGGYNPQAMPTRATVQAVGEWEPPVPFESVDVPDFPVEVLPKPLEAFVECLAESTQTPEEMAGTLSLGVLATAFQSKYTAEVTSDWKEPLCIWASAVAEPGERKSAVLAALNAPMYEFEAERRRAEQGKIARNQTERKLLEARLQDAQKIKKGKNAMSVEAQEAEAFRLAEQLAEFKDLRPYRLLIDDTTTEKLADIMESQGGCITVASAEGGIFDTMTGRYDRSANFDVFLKAHSGDTISVERVTRKGNEIPHPRLSMMLTVQPNVLAGLMGNSNLKGRGMCGRFLYAVCRSKVGRRKITPAPIPPEVKEAYRQFVRRILSDDGKGVIRLSPVADRVRVDWQTYIEGKLGGDWEHMRDWSGKLTGATVRIAALIHAATVQGDPTQTPIHEEVMRGAVKIANALSIHAEAAYQAMGGNPAYEDAKYLWKRIVGSGKNEISRRDLYRLCKGKFKISEEMQAPLQVLTERGYIREIERQTGGRPTRIIAVNPLAK